MIRRVRADDVAPLTDVLERAFRDYPPFVWLDGDSRRRARRVRRMYGGRLRTLWDAELSVTTEDRAGVALWAPPGGWGVPPRELLRSLPASIGRRTLPLIAGMRRVEKLHPRAPHHYLAVVGVDPARHGSGLGTALLRPGLDRCDREATPAFLETSLESNVGWYERLGFEVTERLELPGGQPPVWLMWRTPR